MEERGGFGFSRPSLAVQISTVRRQALASISPRALIGDRRWRSMRASRGRVRVGGRKGEGGGPSPLSSSLSQTVWQGRADAKNERKRGGERRGGSEERGRERERA
eukprot:3866509-Rhodomonas_salina.2